MVNSQLIIHNNIRGLYLIIRVVQIKSYCRSEIFKVSIDITLLHRYTLKYFLFRTNFQFRLCFYKDGKLKCSINKNSHVVLLFKQCFNFFIFIRISSLFFWFLEIVQSKTIKLIFGFQIKLKKSLFPTLDQIIKKRKEKRLRKRYLQKWNLFTHSELQFF